MTADDLHRELGALGFDTSQPPPALPPLRLFVVHRPLVMALPEIGRKGDDVMVEAHGLEIKDGCLYFYTFVSETRDGRPIVLQYCRRAFAQWSDVEELPQNSSKAVN